MQKATLLRHIKVLSLLIAISPLALAQSTDYSKIFNRWDDAVEWVSRNKTWMKEVCDEYEVDYEMASAIVFPELVRFSRYRDVLETIANKTLYVKFGRECSDFSIGLFQMKPSFAEDIIFSNELSQRKIYEIINIDETKGDESELREQIVNSLQEERSSFRYIVAFMKICEKRYDLTNMDEYERVVFLSTIYNCGLKTAQDDVSDLANKKFFSDKISTDTYYSYSDVALWYYRYYRSGKKPILV